MVVKKSMKVAMAVFLALLMVFSIVGVIGSQISSNNNTSTITEYNGYTFRFTQEGYITEIGGNQVAFSLLPTEVEELSTFPIMLQGEKFYLAKDPSLNISITSAQQRLGAFGNFVGSKAVLACSDEKGCSEDIPIANCQNEELVLQFRNGPRDIILEDQNCYILQAENEYEFYQLAEYIIYRTAGIIQQ